MAIKTIIDINGTPENVTVVDVDITGSVIYLTFISDLTQEVYVIQVQKDRPYDIPTKIGDFISLAGSDGIADQIGQPNGIASLDVNGKVPASQMPPISITDVFVVNSQAAMLALTAERGDVAVRTDISKTFILQSEPASTLSNWVELPSSGGTVTGALNVGTGSGWFKALNATTLEFKSLIAASSKLSIVSNTDDLTLDINESNLSLNNIGGTLSAIKGGTGFSSYAIGDILYADSTTTLTKLNAGTDGYVLTLTSGVPIWAPTASTISGTVDTFPIFTGINTLGDSLLQKIGTALVSDYTEISGRIDGTTNLGSATRRFSTLFMASIINIASGSNLQIGHGSNDLVVHSSGRILIGTATDDGSNILQVNGSTSISNLIYAKGGIEIGIASTGGPGRIYYTAANGNVIWAAAGSVTNFALATSSGATVFYVAQGTSDITLGANLLANDGVSTLGDATHRFSTLFMSSVINIKSGSSLQIGHGSNDLVVHSSGRILIGTATDDTSNKLQVSGTLKLTASLATAEFGTSGVLDKLEMFSGSLTDHMSIRLGRTSQEGTFGVAAASGNFSNISVSGDAILRADAGNLILSAKNATNHIKFTTGSTDSEKMRLTNAGRVLIGTTTDNTIDLLQLNGSLKVTTSGSNARLYNASGFFTFEMYSGASNIATDIEFGRTAFEALLGIAEVNGRYSNYATGGSFALVSRNGHLILSAQTNSHDIIMSNGASDIARLIVKAGGRILIGTTTDDTSNRLQIDGSVRIIDNRLKLDNGSNTRHLYTDSSGIFHITNEVGGSDHLTLNTSGALTIAGGITSTGGGLTALGNLTINTSAFVVIAATSKVGIGVASPDEALDVNGKIQYRNGSFKRHIYTDGSGIFHFTNEAANADHLTINTSGDLTIERLVVAKGLVLNTSSKTTNYTLTPSDFTVEFDCTSGNLVATLPASPTTGQIFNIRKSDSSGNQLQLSGNGNNINGSSTKETTTQYFNWTVQFNGTEWMIL